jgi:hypothetical protein
MTKPRPKNEVAFSELYPALDEQEHLAAAENLDRYLELACRIYERTRLESVTAAQSPALTAENARSTIASRKSGPTSPSLPSPST